MIITIDITENNVDFEVQESGPTGNPGTQRDYRESREEGLELQLVEVE